VNAERSRRIKKTKTRKKNKERRKKISYKKRPV